MTMNTTKQQADNVTRASLWRTAAIDASLLGAACLVPTLSHLTALPLYQANPMLWMLLAALLLVRNRRAGWFNLRGANAMLLALLLPTVSMLAVGMPSPAKALCMAVELFTVAGLYSLLESRVHASRWAHLGLILAAILAGKGVYYGLKALLLGTATLVGTPLLTQLFAALAAALLFAILLPKKSL